MKVVACLLVGMSLLVAAPSTAAAQMPVDQVDPVAVAASAPLAGREDLDTAISPCQNFYQYATGGFWHPLDSLLLLNMLPRGSSGIGAPLGQFGLMRNTTRQTNVGVHVLTYVEAGMRQLVARSPALVAAGTTDPTLRVVGTFYGSCVRDTTGLAEGSVADTGRDGARTLYCFGQTRQYLERALFELFLEHVWNAPARQETRRFWPLLRGAAEARFEASPAFDTTTRRYLRAITNGLVAWSHVPWDTAPLPPLQWGAGVRGPSDVASLIGAKGDPGMMATWIYRNYSTLQLSPTDLRQNIERLQAAPDTVELPMVPAVLTDDGRFAELPADTEGGHPLNSSSFMGEVINELNRSWLIPFGYQGPNSGYDHIGPFLPYFFFFPSLVDGQLDLGAWYGMVGFVSGHETAHNYDEMVLKTAPDSELVAFATELFHGQVMSYDHPFVDAFGILIAHDAFERAMQGHPQAVINGFTPEQRFFLGVAWAVPQKNLEVRGLVNNRGPVTVNGTLSVMPSFARAFGCKAGDPMAGGITWSRAPWHGVTFSAAARREMSRKYEPLLQTLAQELLQGPQGPSRDKKSLSEDKLERQKRLERERLVRSQVREFVEASRAKYEARREALFGIQKGENRPGLVADLDAIYQLIGQELGDLRAGLPPAQRATFDAVVHHWDALPARDSEHHLVLFRYESLLKIPGVAP